MHASFTNLLRSSPLVGLWSSKILILKKDRDIRVMERRKHTTANAAMPQKSQGKAETYTGHNLRQRGGILKFFCIIHKYGMKKMAPFFCRLLVFCGWGYFNRSWANACRFLGKKNLNSSWGQGNFQRPKISSPKPLPQGESSTLNVKLAWDQPTPLLITETPLHLLFLHKLHHG